MSLLTDTTVVRVRRSGAIRIYTQALSSCRQDTILRLATVNKRARCMFRVATRDTTDMVGMKNGCTRDQEYIIYSLKRTGVRYHCSNGVFVAIATTVGIT